MERKEGKNMEISYWSDIACPFCYIGASRMKRAMAAVGLNPEDLTMKAYQLNPNAPLETSETMLTEFATSHGMTTEQVKAQFAHMESMGNEEGLRMIWRGLSQPTLFQLTVLLNGRRSI
ncbi:DsbA family oxidoreductase [Streptococcus pneumoniae]|uniref:DsbA family oxidoreductase n=1 Tax=Streptococcus pneumoniae TaxID=1313 RepID=UPI0021507BE7|nr:DsbA family protein [Streptococcus pneumoniae]